MLLKVIAVISAVAAAGICLWNGAFAGIAWLWMLPVSFLGCLLAQVLGVFLYLLYLCARVDQSVPQEEDDPHYRKVVDLIIDAALPVLQIHVQKKGLEKIPQTGRFLLVSNHDNDSDPVILLNCFRKSQLAFVSKQENKDMFVVGPVMHKMLGQLINRENDREALKTILKCIEILKEDKASVAIFPEGGILTNDGKLHPFRPGVFKIAQRAKVPIVVCSLKNTKDVVRNLFRLKPSYVEMTVLDVIPAEELVGVTTVDISKRCYQLIADDLGPDMIAQQQKT